MRSRDTTKEAEAVQLTHFARMSGAQRIDAVFAASEALREITRAGIRSRHPEYERTEVEHALLRMILGDDLFRRAYPGAPLLAP